MFVFWKADSKAKGIKEANVELSVVRDKDAAFSELLDFESGFFFGKAVFDHLIGDVSLPLNVLRDMNAGVDEEIFSVSHEAIDDQNSTEFGDSVVLGRKTCGFEIEYAVLSFGKRSIDEVPAITWLFEGV